MENIATSARLMTDESSLYTKVRSPFASHEAVEHSLYEYVRGEAHINSAESLLLTAQAAAVRDAPCREQEAPPPLPG